MTSPQKSLSMSTGKRSMPTIKPRTRVVYFRISEEEFTKFCDLCEEQGARSLSELARIAVYAMLQPAGDGLKDGKDISRRLSDLERSILELNDHLRTLTQVPENESKQIYRGKL